MELEKRRENFKRLMMDCLLAALQAGEAILEVYNTDFEVEEKEDNSPLTLADMQSHRIITDILSDTVFEGKSIPILSEEGRDISFKDRCGWEYFWLVDPLDGTKEFVKRNGEFTVNIALIHKGKPIAGIIFIPVKDSLYFAAEGHGVYKLERANQYKGLISAMEDHAYRYNELLKYATDLKSRQERPKQNGHLRIIGSRSHRSQKMEEFLEELGKDYKEIEIFPAGSSLKFCLIAEGTADLYPRFGPTMEWDTAAGQAIVEEAGGVVVSVETKAPLLYNKENLLNPWFMVAGSGIKASLSSFLNKV